MPSPPFSSSARKGLVSLACALSLALAGCPTVPAEVPKVRDPNATKWLQRASSDLRVADVEEARDSIEKALSLAPEDEEVRMVAAQVRLAMLDYAEAVKLLKGIKGSKAAGLRGRALWYKGDLEAAADALEEMLNDPDVVDDWAKGVAKLARRGAGRTPFTLSGGLLAAVDMPHVSPTAPYFVVQVEIDGEPGLALVSTRFGEVRLDSATRAEPSWVSLRFGGQFEVQDVPALTHDLNGLSKEIGAPIKAIIGVNLLRHVHATIDWGGHQFVARSFSPPPPPEATRMPLFYAKGSGMLMKCRLGDKPASMMIDTEMDRPMALDEDGWKKAGVDMKDLTPVPDSPLKLKGGVVPVLKIGAAEINNVPAVLGGPIKDQEDKLGSDLDGIMGNGLLAFYRITFGDGGRLMWLEDHIAWQMSLDPGQGAPPSGPVNQGVAPDQVPSVIVPGPPAPSGSSPPPAPKPSSNPGVGSGNPPPGGAPKRP